MHGGGDPRRQHLRHPVPGPDKHVPKHRNAPSSTVVKHAPKRALRSVLLMACLALILTGVVVSGGVLAPGNEAGLSLAGSDTNSDTDSSTPDPGLSDETSAAPVREALVSRADSRAIADPAKAALLAQGDGPAMTRTEDISDEDPRIIARALLTEFGFEQSEFDCLDSLYASESGWRVNADNPNSSAYGIPQALPGSKMSSAGADWATNPVTQIRWGLGYIQDRYGTPCGAWSFKRGRGWY